MSFNVGSARHQKTIESREGGKFHKIYRLTVINESINFLSSIVGP